MSKAGPRRVLLYVQHLLGIGHLRRTAIIAQACAAAGLEVMLVSGGTPVPDLDTGGAGLVQLPPTVATDASFKVLMDENGRPVDEAWKLRRRDRLLELWRSFQPHALVTELYPFGRRLMRFELVPLLEAATRARHRPVIVSSARDVLQDNEDNAPRVQKMLEAFERYFDWALVHGDPAFIPFERTFPHAARIAARTAYTGYVVDRTPEPEADDQGSDAEGEVLVSAGGGAFGAAVLETALRARPATVLADRPWRVRAGVDPAPERIEALRRLAADRGGGPVIVEPNRPDFRARLRRCALSISQAGYNTLLETLQANARAVMVPYVGRKETEQTLRARLFEARGAIDLVDEAVLAADTLAAAIDRAVRRPRAAARVAIDMNGAARSAARLVEWTGALDW